MTFLCNPTLPTLEHGLEKCASVWQWGNKAENPWGFYRVKSYISYRKMLGYAPKSIFKIWYLFEFLWYRNSETAKMIVVIFPIKYNKFGNKILSAYLLTHTNFCKMAEITQYYNFWSKQYFDKIIDGFDQATYTKHKTYLIVEIGSHTKRLQYKTFGQKVDFQKLITFLSVMIWKFWDVQNACVTFLYQIQCLSVKNNWQTPSNQK